MKTILVPTDFSANATNAVNYAVALAKKEKAKLILLHAFDIIYLSPDVPMDMISEEIKDAELSSEKKLRSLILKIKKTAKIDCEIINKKGLAIDIIIDAIKKRKPDFVIMGTKGASGLKGVIMGSNTAKIIERSNCPVMAIPEKAVFKKIKNITYATDYQASDIEALKKVIEMGKFFNSTITVLHASDEEFTHYSEEEYMREFEKKVRKRIKYDKIVYKLVYGKRLSKIFEDYIKNESPDLLVMSTHFRNLFDRIFGSSVTKQMVYHTQIPLLAFHHDKEVVNFI